MRGVANLFDVLSMLTHCKASHIMYNENVFKGPDSHCESFLKRFILKQDSAESAPLEDTDS